MKYLTIDTTTKVTALSLAENGILVGEMFLHTGKNHSEKLIPMLDMLLEAADWKSGDLNSIGVVRGPGSFTGIRIGIATAQGLAQVLKIPLIGITSLDSLAWAGWGRKEDTVVILDARKNEWYYARYRQGVKRELIDGPKAIAPERLTAELAVSGEGFFFAGDAVGSAGPYLKQMLGERAVIPPGYQYLPRGAYTAAEVWKHRLELQIKQAENFDCKENWHIEPLYLRLSEAEVNYRKKNLQKRQEDKC